MKKLIFALFMLGAMIGSADAQNEVNKTNYNHMDWEFNFIDPCFPNVSEVNNQCVIGVGQFFSKKGGYTAECLTCSLGGSTMYCIESKMAAVGIATPVELFSIGSL